MIAALAYTAVVLVIAWCVACGTGHRRLSCLYRSARTWTLIGWTLLLIGAVRVIWPLRHPARHARYLAARVFRRIPGRRDDGEPLGWDEARDFIGIVRGWKHTAAEPERSRT